MKKITKKAKPQIELENSEVTGTNFVPVIEERISLMPVDMGREDLNKIAHKVNEIITKING